MIRTLLQFSMPSPARCLIAVCILALCACAPQGTRPDDIPDVPPLAYTPATEVPAETFTTIPTDPSAAASIPPASSATPATAAAPAKSTAPGTKPMSSEDQRIAALELSLLNMSNELAWLKSQPTNPTTPWGTPSPKVVPTNPLDVQDMAQPAPAPAPAGKAAPMASTDKAQAERIATLERNMQAIRDELRELRGQNAAPASPWGKSAPSLAGAGATPAPTVHTGPVPAAVPPPAPIQPQATASAPQPAGAAPAPQSQAQPPVATTPAPAPMPVAPASVAATQTMPAQPPASTPTPAPTGAAPVAAPGQPQPTGSQPTVVEVTEARPQTALSHIPQPSPEAMATPPLRRSGATAARPAYTAPAQTAAPMLAQTPAPQTATPQTPPPAQTAQTSRPLYTPPPASPVQASPAQPAPARSGEQAAYQAALNAYENRNYNEAWNGFDRYLADYPNGRFVPNALYWKGEVRYSLGDYAGAILQFKDVIGRFPQHQKAPDALLKIVMSYNRLQDKDNATLHLRILNEDYPRSEAARRAKSLKLS